MKCERALAKVFYEGGSKRSEVGGDGRRIFVDRLKVLSQKA